jgi:hypothetical protein
MAKMTKRPTNTTEIFSDRSYAIHGRLYGKWWMSPISRLMT